TINIDFRKNLKMAIEAPISKFKKNGLKIYIAVCIVVAIIFAYDARRILGRQIFLYSKGIVGL
ncbi:unnamed protein product, partial [marine sediment metagenome]